MVRIQDILPILPICVHIPREPSTNQMDLISPSEPLGRGVLARHFHHRDGRALPADRRLVATNAFSLPDEATSRLRGQLCIQIPPR